MNCRNTRKNYLLFIEEALTEGQSAAIGNHMLSCSACNALVSRGREMFLSLNADRVVYDDPFFFTRVVSRLEQKRATDSLPLLTLRPLVLAFAVIIPLLAGVWLGYSSYQQQYLDPMGKKLAMEMSTLLTLPGYASLEDYAEPNNE